MGKFPIATCEKIIREIDENIRVSKDGAKELSKVLDERARVIAKKAIELCKHAKRKTVKQKDIILANGGM